MVLVDTSIWSLAVRRRRQDLSRQEQRVVLEWASLVKAGRAALTGPVRQEVLSGIRHESGFATLQRKLSSFAYLEIVPGDYDRAAAFFNACRAKGISGTPIDMLLCAVAERHNVPIFTTDTDFIHYAHVLPIRLHAMSVTGRDS
jgi:hypothetical protein